MSLLHTYRELLRRNGALARLLFGEFVSSIGDWLYLVAILVVVYQEGGSPVLLGIVGAARILPYVLLSVPAGVVADRFDRRMILLVTDIARGALMLLLAAVVIVDAPTVFIIAISILAALVKLRQVCCHPRLLKLPVDDEKLETLPTPGKAKE